MDRVEAFLTGLAAAALEPGLRRILALDLSYEAMWAVAPIVGEMLRVTTGSDIRTVLLPANASDEDLWGRLVPIGRERKDVHTRELTFVWRNGLLAQNRSEDSCLLVLIPDLSFLSLSVMRNCLLFLDPDIVHLERSNKSYLWRPRIFWLAACERQKLGRVSSHILDRFLLRLSGVGLSDESMIRKLTNESDRPYSPQIRVDEVWLDSIYAALKRARDRWPLTSDEAIEQTIKAFVSHNAEGARRDLSLGYLSRAMARLKDDEVVKASHVFEAASLIGVKFAEAILPPSEDTSSETAEKSNEKPPAGLNPPPETFVNAPPLVELFVGPTENSVSAEFPSQDLPSIDPYFDDQAPIERELYPLRLPVRRLFSSTSNRGPIVGIEPAANLTDLAIVPTLFRAFLFQKIRRMYNPAVKDELLLSPVDLRRYRRLPPPDQLLLLVHDYTCLRDCLWQEALTPHLRWAYEKRASVCLVRVGASDSADELRAEKLWVKSLLTPALGRALEARPGRATPLAHALEIVHGTIIQAQQHGRNPITLTRLVILTDGRGNVPLAASHSGIMPSAVNREGIEDTQLLAEAVARLPHVHCLVLDPQPRQHQELPVILASLLNGSIEIIQLKPEVLLSEQVH